MRFSETQHAKMAAHLKRKGASMPKAMQPFYQKKARSFRALAKMAGRQSNEKPTEVEPISGSS